MLDYVARINYLQEDFFLKFDDTESYSKNADTYVRVALRKMR